MQKPQREREENKNVLTFLYKNFPSWVSHSALRALHSHNFFAKRAPSLQAPKMTLVPSFFEIVEIN